jgi:mono/diheme cytochrome c family protein
MRRTTSIQDEEKRSYGALWLLCALLLFVGALWAIADDNVFRRPWKRYQAEFNRREIARLEDQIAAEQKRLDADPAYQAAENALREARVNVGSGDSSRRIAALQADVKRAQEADQSKDLNLRFVKSELEELRYKYDEAVQTGRPADDILHEIQAKEQVRVGRQQVYSESQQHIQELQDQIKALQGAVKTAEDELAKLTTTRDDLQQKLEGVSLGYFPGPTARPPFVHAAWQPKIPKIQQVVLEEFDRNNFDKPIARVDRCTSCHAGINKAGFEDQPNPWKTHPKRELLLGKHSPEKFGCTPCHNGQGPAVNSPETAHGNFVDAHGHVDNVEFVEQPMLRGEKMQANCIKCHAVQHLEGAETIARGERLFEDLGCHGCHLTDGYEDLAKASGVPIIGPSLRRIGAKLDHAWMVRWITNPHAVRPRTRMPNFMFEEGQAVQIAAYLLSDTQQPSVEWRAGHPAPAVDAALADKGKELVGSLGCRACHALAPDEIAGQLGANKDIAPNLSGIGEKTDAQWIYNWIRNPRGYSAVARMPNLRLSDDEARAITAYLVTLGAKIASCRHSARRRRRSSSSATAPTFRRPGTTGRTTSSRRRAPTRPSGSSR